MVLASETHAAAIRNNGGLFVWLAALDPFPPFVSDRYPESDLRYDSHID
jgi:hypothetical protein